MRRLLLLLALLATLWPVSVRGEVDCRPPVTGSRWAPMPVTYRVDASLSADFVREAAAKWETGTIQFREDPASPNVIGAARLTYDMARTTMSGGTFSITVDKYRTNDFGTVKLLTHEFGHVLGFGHASCTSSIMYAQPFAWDLSTEDLAARDALYPVHRLYLPSLQR